MEGGGDLEPIEVPRPHATFSEEPASPFLPVVIGDERLTPPKTAGDCTCLFCSRFRSHHYWVGAVAAAVAVVAAFAFVATTKAFLGQLNKSNNTSGGGDLVGYVLLIATASVVLFLVTWRRPVRRLFHRMRPRATSWPPPA